MTHIDALRALRDAVKTGARGLGWNTSSAFGDTQAAMDAVDAIDGSLDAANALHKAVLPDYIAQADTTGFAMIWRDEMEVTHSFDALVPGNPARAWLLAILAALIAAAEASAEKEG